MGQLAQPRLALLAREPDQLGQRAADDPAHERRRLSAESGFWKTICSARTCSSLRLAMVGAAACRRARHRSLVSAGQAEQRARQRGLAAPGLADQPERLAGPEANTTSASAWTARPSWWKVFPTSRARSTGTTPCRSSRRRRHWISAGPLGHPRQLVRSLVEVAPGSVAAAEVVQRRLLAVADAPPPARSARRTRNRAARRPSAGREARDRVEPAAGPCARRRAGCSAATPPCTGGAGCRTRPATSPSSTSRPA